MHLKPITLILTLLFCLSGSVFAGESDQELEVILGGGWFDKPTPFGAFSNYAAIPLINVSTYSTTFSSTRFRAGARSANFSGRLINSIISGSGKGFLPV
jgi:hypothetical protein